jgi:hypothetical protein
MITIIAEVTSVNLPEKKAIWRSAEARLGGDKFAKGHLIWQ